MLHVHVSCCWVAVVGLVQQLLCIWWREHLDLWRYVFFEVKFGFSVFSMIFSYWKDTKIYHTLPGSLGIYTSIELAELVSSGPGDLGRPQGWSRQSSCEGGESWGFGKVASNVSVSRPGFLSFRMIFWAKNETIFGRKRVFCFFGRLETDLNPSSETYMKPWWSLDFWELSGGFWRTPRARSLVSPGARGIFQTSTLRWWFSRQDIGTFGGNFGNFAEMGHFFTNHFFTRFLKAFQNCMELWTLRLCVFMYLILPAKFRARWTGRN